MTWLHAIVLGVVEGVTEFLPVSSTGHLILAADLLGLKETEFLKSFEIAIQMGAILAVVASAWRRFFRERAVLLRVIVAFLPTAVIGLALYGVIKKHLLGNELVVVWALVLGGLALLAFEKFNTPPKHAKTDLSKMSYKDAVLIGLSQALAIIPGTSRSASTILGGMALGWSRAAIVEFSFLLAVPTMAAATGLDLLKSGFAFSTDEYGLLAIGFATAYVVASAAVKWFLAYVRTNDFAGFGFYRIFAAFAFWWFILR
ncbi:MAG TPA: undecaprenyl-diphosphate phosphatase [Candidatus Baltobacteraceae bacterium]|nr:undecaprenyl-diphosphate phosphatase [Candidatus Baltobacteraceae bacterium]